MNDGVATAEITLSVPGMTCGHCEDAVEREVGAVAGVDHVSVDLERTSVTVRGADLDRTAIVEAIDEAGFDVV